MRKKNKIYITFLSYNTKNSIYSINAGNDGMKIRQKIKEVVQITENRC